MSHIAWREAIGIVGAVTILVSLSVIACLVVLAAVQ